MNRKHAGYTGVNLNLDAVNEGEITSDNESAKPNCFQLVLFGLHAIAACGSIGLRIGSSFGLIIGNESSTGRISAWWGKATRGPRECAPKFNDTSICPYQGQDDPMRFEIDFSLLLIFSQLITASSHFIRYIRFDWVSVLDVHQTQSGVKLICWIEYVFTAAMTSHVILHLGGMWDIRTQLIAYAAQAGLMVVWLAQDLLRAIQLSAQPRHYRIHCRIGISFLFLIGIFGLMTVWIWPLLTVWSGINLGSSDKIPPKWLQWLILVEFLLYASFGVVQLAFYVPCLLGWTSEDIRKCFWWEQILFDVFSVLSKLVLNFAFSWCFVLHKCGP